MKFEEFKIGEVFFTKTKSFICTDKGTRTVVAVEENEETKSEMPGPFHNYEEFVFNAYDFPSCHKHKD